MITSAMPSTSIAMFLSDEPFTQRQIANIEGTAQNIAHSAVLDILEKVVPERKLTRAFMARKLNRDPALISRWLGSPGNWTLETLGLLMAAMGHIPTIGGQDVRDITRAKNYQHPAAELAKPVKIDVHSWPTNSIAKISIRDENKFEHRSNAA